MRPVGVEPTRPCGHQAGNLTRLPFRHGRTLSAGWRNELHPRPAGTTYPAASLTALNVGSRHVVVKGKADNPFHINSRICLVMTPP